MDTDDFDGFIPGDWGQNTGGRRRKNRKYYGEVPVLHETALSEAYADEGCDSGWKGKQVSKSSVVSANGIFLNEDVLVVHYDSL